MVVNMPFPIKLFQQRQLIIYIQLLIVIIIYILKENIVNYSTEVKSCMRHP